jgi:hydrogenase maturation protease
LTGVKPVGTPPIARTVVLGLGNPLLSDDAAGLAVAAELTRLLAERPIVGVEVATSSRGGFELIDLLAGFQRAVIVDALITDDPRPGNVHRLDPGQVAGSARLVGSHEVGLATALELAEALGIVMPETVTVYGVEAADVTTFAETPTPEVAEAAVRLARELHESLLSGTPL